MFISRFTLFSATVAFLFWGGWAFYVNYTSAAIGNASPLLSGLTQGIGSFTITLIMVHVVGCLYFRIPGHPARLFLPTVITIGSSGLVLALSHLVIGTKSILATIIPSLSVGVVFNLLITFKLWRDEIRDNHQNPSD